MDRPIMKTQGRSKASPLGGKLDLGGKYYFPNIRIGRLNAEKEVNRAVLDEFKKQYDVKMFRHVHGNADFRGLDFPNEEDLSMVAKRVFSLLKHVRRMLKRHLWSIQIPKELLEEITELSLRDKEAYFKQECTGGYLKYLFRELPMEWWKWIL